MATNKGTQGRFAVGSLQIGSAPGRRLGGATLKPSPIVIDYVGSVSAVITPTASLLANTVFTTTVTVNGIQVVGTESLAIPEVGYTTSTVLGDIILPVAPAALETGLLFNAFVSAADTVTIRIANPTAGTIVTSARTWAFVWFKLVLP